VNGGGKVAQIGGKAWGSPHFSTVKKAAIGIERELKVFRGYRNDREEAELDEQRGVYPRGPSESPLAKAIAAKRSELR